MPPLNSVPQVPTNNTTVSTQTSNWWVDVLGQTVGGILFANKTGNPTTNPTTTGQSPSTTTPGATPTLWDNVTNQGLNPLWLLAVIIGFVAFKFMSKK